MRSDYLTKLTNIISSAKNAGQEIASRLTGASMPIASPPQPVDSTSDTQADLMPQETAERESMTFADLGLSPETLKAIEDSGYTQPTPIQKEAIPVTLMGRDVLGCAQTGTGKTASFTLPMIDILAAGQAKARMPRSLILAPTRELAAQVAKNFEQYGKYHSLSMALLIGGESFSDQEKVLDRGADVLIATPGRLLDMFERGRILMNDVKILVIDEADRMLDMGFIPDVEKIVSFLPKIRQTLFFSATMAPEIRRLADAFLINPKEITVTPTSSAATTVTQGLAIVAEREKREALRRLIRKEEVKTAFVFCNRKRDVEILYRSLSRHGFSVIRLHGDMPQHVRTETLHKFQNGEATIMVCSDVAARGIDIADISHVFNFDPPLQAEDYIHRIGRTGRAGREGRAFTLATPFDGKLVDAIEKVVGHSIDRIEIEGIQSLEFEEKGKKGSAWRAKDGKPAGEEAKRSDIKRDDAGRGDSKRGTQGKPNARRSDRGDQGRQTQESFIAAEPAENESWTLPTSSHSSPAPSGYNKPHDRRRERRRAFDEFGIGEMKHADNVVGFGDHIPNFMLKAAPLAAIGSGSGAEEE